MLYQIVSKRTVQNIDIQTKRDFCLLINDIAETLMKCYEKRRLASLFCKQTNLTENEQMFIRKECQKLLSINHDFLKFFLEEELLLYCSKEQKIIHLDGYLRFRAKKYRSAVHRLIEDVLNQFIVKSEYQQLIEGLSDYLQMQESMIDTVLLTQNENDYIVTDKNKCEILKLSKFDEPLLDVLLTLAPKKIIINRPQSFLNQDLLETVISLFGDRIQLINDSSW